MKAARTARRAERGQVLVIVAMGMVVIVAMVGLVIDGGYAWIRQRDTQNGADAVAKAGTIVVQHYIAGESPEPNDYDVACAVAGAAAANGVTVVAAEYTDYLGEPLVPAAPVGACTTDLGDGIPAGAQGVKALTSETFDTFLMPVIGVPQLTTLADAIAVVGALEVIPGGALPVTFPEEVTICDLSDPPLRFPIRANDGDPDWEPYEIIDALDADADNLAIVPLCDIAPGSVGWLEWDCRQNLSQAIADPCGLPIPIPAWVHTQTGNVNALDDELNAYTGGQAGEPEDADIVLAIPIHDFTCRQDVPDDALPSDCPTPDWSGNGDNLYYHIPYWVPFKLDAAHTQGGDPECGEPDGQPLIENPYPPGKVGCLKGWFVDAFITRGPIDLRPIAPGSPLPLVVTLIN